MSVKDLYQSKGDWLKADDLKKKAIRVIISDAKIEKVGEDDRIVLSFKDKEKKLVLNKTNADVVADVYGDEELAWIDHEIIMYPTVCEYKGDSVACIRVRIDTEPVEGDELPDF